MKSQRKIKRERERERERERQKEKERSTVVRVGMIPVSLGIIALPEVHSTKTSHVPIPFPFISLYLSPNNLIPTLYHSRLGKTD